MAPKSSRLGTDDNNRSIQAFPLVADNIGNSSGTIDVTGKTMITFDTDVTIQLNATGTTFAVVAGSRWSIDPTVTSIKVSASTNYILA